MRVDPELHALIPALSDDERTQLEANVLAEGCRDALVVWAETGILLDGHNRLDICQRHNMDYATVDLSFPDREAAKEWIILNQLGRRNLHPDAASLLRGRLYNARKTAGHGARTGYQNDTQNRTRERVAEDTGVSPATISRDGAFAEAIDVLATDDPGIVQRAMSGDIPSRKAVIEKVKEPKAAPHVTHNSGNNEWYTPPEYIEAARRVMGGIDLDPASSDNANETVQARTYYTAEDDGLLHDWRGRVYMNPPYASHLIGLFAEKLAEHVKRGEVIEACVLVNNATETGWFNALLDVASAVCFIRGRVKFIDMDGNPSGAPLQGQALLYIGPSADNFGRIFAQFGRVLYAWGDPEQTKSATD